MRKSFSLDQVTAGRALMRPLNSALRRKDSHKSSAVAAAQIAAVIRLFLKQAERRIVAMIRPVDAARAQILRHGLEWREEFSLLNGERANGKLHRRALLQQQKRVEHGERILAARQRHSHAIAFANHLEFRDGLADLAKQCFFQVHASILSGIRTRPAVRPRKVDIASGQTLRASAARCPGGCCPPRSAPCVCCSSDSRRPAPGRRFPTNAPCPPVGTPRRRRSVAEAWPRPPAPSWFPAAR